MTSMSAGELYGVPSNEPPDEVMNPPHYTRLSPQPIEVICAWDLNFCRASALKYISRAGHKGPAEVDIRKAIKCLEFELERMTNER
jgi:hypothetical protein